jgi:hypothetical protein
MSRTELESMRSADLEAFSSAELESVRDVELGLTRRTDLESMRRTGLESMRRSELDSTNSAELESMPTVDRQLVPGAELESTFNTEFEAKPSFVNLPDQAIMMMAGALLVGWLLGSISSKFRPKRGTRRLGRRDGRIQSLEAKLRIALADAEKKGNTIATVEKELADVRANAEKPNKVISDQQEQIVNLKKDLRYSIIKTRELRAEVADRAVENVRSEVKLRQLETKLQVAQVSTNLSASGVPEYSLKAHTKKKRGKPVDQLTRIRPPTIN